jgi:hypothetical protein
MECSKSNMKGAHPYNPSYSHLCSHLRGRVGGSQFEASLGKQFTRLYLKKPYHKKGLVEWLKL